MKDTFCDFLQNFFTSLLHVLDNFIFLYAFSPQSINILLQLSIFLLDLFKFVDFILSPDVVSTISSAFLVPVLSHQELALPLLDLFQYF